MRAGEHGRRRPPEPRGRPQPLRAPKERRLMLRGLLTTKQAAEILAVSEDFIRSHAAELGAIRLGGSRGPLRFEDARLRDYIDRRRLPLPPRPSARRRPGPARNPDGVELLPLPED